MIKLIYLVLYIFSIYAAADISNTSNNDEWKQWCQIQKEKHNIDVGINWGSLPTESQTQWINLQCDKYFCKHDPLFGKDVFKCEKL